MFSFLYRDLPWKQTWKPQGKNLGRSWTKAPLPQGFSTAGAWSRDNSRGATGAIGGGFCCGVGTLVPSWWGSLPSTLPKPGFRAEGADCGSALRNYPFLPQIRGGRCFCSCFFSRCSGAFVDLIDKFLQGDGNNTIHKQWYSLLEQDMALMWFWFLK